MGYDRGNSFPFDSEPNGIPFGSKSKGKLSSRSYPIQCERNWKYSFLSVTDVPISSSHIRLRNTITAFLVGKFVHVCKSWNATFTFTNNDKKEQNWHSVNLKGIPVPILFRGPLNWLRENSDICILSEISSCDYTEKTTFAFPFTLNGIWLCWQFSFRF